MTSNADIERYSAAVRAATSYAEALTLAAPLIAEAQHHSAAAVALVDLVGESLFDFEESEKLLSDLLAQADHELLAQIGRAAAAVVNIDDLNAAPVAPRFFTDLVGRLQQCCALEPSNAQLAAALASAAHRGGRSFDEVAEGAFAAAISLEPDNPNHRYNRGLFYKTRGRFEESVEDNRQALALGMQNDGAKWNVGIAATASAQGALALETFRGLGLKLELSPAGRAEGTFPTCMFRVAVRPVAERDSQQDDPGGEETVWLERIGAAHGIVRSVLTRDLGVDYGDVVVFDGAPIERHEVGGREVPVFPHLMTLERRHYQRYPFAGEQREPQQDMVASKLLPGDAVLYSHTEQHTNVVGALMAPRDIPPAELRKALDSALARTPALRVACPELSRAAGVFDEAEERRFQEWAPLVD
jgi:tetratricopeptide (TPR) repeat protein